MNFFGKIALALLLVTGALTASMAQCQNWNDSPQKEAAENAHVTYRVYLKDKTPEELQKLSEEDFKLAFENWKKAYEIAPAADGQRPFHFQDGRKLYKAMMNKATDDAKKAEYAKQVLALYDQEMQCYPKEKAFLLGRKGFDQFYLTGYTPDALETLKQAMVEGGNKTEYVVLAPLGELLTYLYQNKQIGKEVVQDLYNRATVIADHNIAAGGTYKAYYESGKANLDASVSKVESEVFDCDYFKKNLLPKFEENRNDVEVVKYIYNKLTQQGCAETDADLAKVKAQYDQLYAAIEAEQEVERRKSNPGYDATKLMQEEKYGEAISRFREALNTADNNDLKGQYYYQIAQAQQQLGQHSGALESARQAANLKSGWGKPYLMIGDIYARMSRNCDDPWQQRLAVLAAIEKYQHARNIDGEVAGDANRRIANYSASLPSKEDAFSRSLNDGARVTASCVGEQVTLRTQK